MITWRGISAGLAGVFEESGVALLREHVFVFMVATRAMIIIMMMMLFVRISIIEMVIFMFIEIVILIMMITWISIWL